MDYIITPIAAELAQLEAFFAQTLKADTEPMDNIMHYVLDTQGKRDKGTGPCSTPRERG